MRLIRERLLVKDAASMSAPGLSSTLECSLCGSGVTPGC